MYQIGMKSKLAHESIKRGQFIVFNIIVIATILLLYSDIKVAF